MGKIIILPETTTLPITTIGRMAGVCWGADITDDKKNYQRGLDCIEANHGRALEYVNVVMIIDGYSARVIREWYTHIGGSPTRLQSSTRYIDYKNFYYITPPSIKNNETAKTLYDSTMKSISNVSTALKKLGLPTEDIAMLLPFGMATMVCDQRNLRNLIDMSRQRMCKRAYWEFRELFQDVLNGLSKISDEWKHVVDTQMKPKCEVLGFCPEKYSCGRKPKKEGR